MKTDDAIKMLKQMQEPGGHVTEYKTSFNALQIAIAALEKQIPMKPKMGGSPFYVYACPNCGVLAEKPKAIPKWLKNTLYCESCGQAIDWGGFI